MANKRRISRNKYEWEAETANWHAVAQHLGVLNGVRIRFFEVMAHQRILDYRRLLYKIADAGLRTTEELVNDGQANAPDLLAAQIAVRQARIDVVHAAEPLPAELEQPDHHRRRRRDAVAGPARRPARIRCARPWTSTPNWPGSWT